jgi:DNA processing protein
MKHTLSSLKPLFWQYLLSAEMPAHKAHAILNELQESSIDPISFLHSHPGLTDGERKRLQSTNLAAFEKATQQGAYLFTSDQYPRTLQNCNYPPPVMFAQGDIDILSKRMIAIVGTRKATNYGKSVAHRFAQRFAQAGVTVVSGGAIGIDTVAHKSVLDAGGKTVAAIPTGIDQLYPTVNHQLFQRMIHQGCILSPFAVGSRFHAARPLIRNHVIAALAEATVVIEAPGKSGALVTAIAAAELSREVFVVPANIDNPNFDGSHLLIREGATLVTNPDQVLEALGLKGQATLFSDTPTQNLTQRKILDLLKIEPLSLEQIIEKTRIDASVLMSELTMLEVDGKVLRNVGGYTLGS